GRPPLTALGTGAGPLGRGTRPVRPLPDGGPAGVGPPVAAHVRTGPRGRPDLRDCPLAAGPAAAVCRGRPWSSRSEDVLGLAAVVDLPLVVAGERVHLHVSGVAQGHV